jgi:hypothetical protein
VGNAVHRLVEQLAAARPGAAAIVDGQGDGGGTLTFRELNGRANTLARRLKESGLARGALAYVRMPRCADLAVVLLAVLKAGAAYVWVEPGSDIDLDLPASVCIAPRAGAGPASQSDRWTAIDITGALRECARRPGPNLPVLTRGSDIACVLPDVKGRPHLLVPHATITSLTQAQPPPADAPSGAAGALDLWVALISGATVTFHGNRRSSAAA